MQIPSSRGAVLRSPLSSHCADACITPELLPRMHAPRRASKTTHASDNPDRGWRLKEAGGVVSVVDEEAPLAVMSCAVMPCAGCDTALSGAVVNALGKQWHSGCFVCGLCGQPFADGMFVEKDSLPFHKECLEAKSAPACGACGKPCAGTFVTACDRTWHPECFVCTQCGSALESGFVSEDGKPFCCKTHVLQHRRAAAKERGAGQGVSSLPPVGPAVAAGAAGVALDAEAAALVEDALAEQEEAAAAAREDGDMDDVRRALRDEIFGNRRQKAREFAKVHARYGEIWGDMGRYGEIWEGARVRQGARPAPRVRVAAAPPCVGEEGGSVRATALTLIGLWCGQPCRGGAHARRHAAGHEEQPDLVVCNRLQPPVAACNRRTWRCGPTSSTWTRRKRRWATLVTACNRRARRKRRWATLVTALLSRGCGWLARGAAREAHCDPTSDLSGARSAAQAFAVAMKEEIEAKVEEKSIYVRPRSRAPSVCPARAQAYACRSRPPRLRLACAPGWPARLAGLRAWLAPQCHPMV